MRLKEIPAGFKAQIFLKFDESQWLYPYRDLDSLNKIVECQPDVVNEKGLSAF